MNSLGPRKRPFSLLGDGQMDTAIAFVDVGFLRGGGLGRLHRNKEQPRPDMIGAGVVSAMEAIVNDLPLQSTLLRTYWYDGRYDPRYKREYDIQSRKLDAIAATPGVQLRMAHLQPKKERWQNAVQRALKECGEGVAEEFAKHFTFRPGWEQKGVDVLIAFDLLRLAQERAFDTALLLTGDRDLAHPVKEIQSLGRRVVLVTPSQTHGTARELLQVADHVHELEIPALQGMFAAAKCVDDSNDSTAEPATAGDV